MQGSAQKAFDYAKYVANGKRYWEVLQKALQDTAHQDRADSTTYFNTRYITTFQPAQSTPANISAFAGKPTDYLLVETRVQVKDAEVAYSNYMNPREGRIIAGYNYALKDVTPDDPEGQPKRLSNSEILWQQYFQATTKMGASFRPLVEIIRSSIQNTDTMQVMTTGVKVVDRTKDLTWKSDSEKFFALLGTDNCKAAAFLLADHKKALGAKTITQFVTRGQSYIRIFIG